jgi:putative transposase
MKNLAYYVQLLKACCHGRESTPRSAGCPTFAVFWHRWASSGFPNKNTSRSTLAFGTPIFINMTLGLERYYGAGDLHFITCSCYRRMQFMTSPPARDEFLRIFEEVRQQYLFTVVGYVVMPEHFHLLISEPTIDDPSAAMFSLKKRTAHNLLTEMRESGREGIPDRFWTKRFYDFNVWTAQKEGEKLAYMHHNPVKRGLVKRPEDWHWSSARYYALGEGGPVKISV